MALLKLTNTSVSPVSVEGYLIQPNETLIVEQYTPEVKALIDQGTLTVFTDVFPPVDLLTDGGLGPNRRLRVDVGQTGFFAGREFRTFKRLSIGVGQTYVIKAVTTIDVILFGISIDLKLGDVEMITLVGGTEGGTFSEVLPRFPRNTMTERPTPYYTSIISITAGGTVTGGTELDVLYVKTSGNTQSAITVGSEMTDERGVGPGTYYFKLINNSANDVATGIFRARWEERLP